jgi:hypothetical protein
MVIVDTPASETDAAAVNAAVAGAQVVVLVVSPSRYGDATTRDVWESIQVVPQVLVVLNRQRGTVQERADILSSVKERFSATNIVVVEESGGSEALRRGLETAVADLDSSDGRAVIARRAAAKAGRHVAGAVTAAAMDLGHVKGAVRSVVSPQISGHGLAVHDSWSATERALTDQIGYSIDALDRAVVDLAAVPLAERMLGSLELWQRSSMKAELAIWRDDAIDRFRSDATVRWRRSTTHQVLDQFSWEAGVNPSVQVPKRVHRVMGTRLASATVQTHERLVKLINDTLVRRLGVWSDEVERIGSFRPGELLAAADRLEASG